MVLHTFFSSRASLLKSLLVLGLSLFDQLHDRAFGIVGGCFRLVLEGLAIAPNDRFGWVVCLWPPLLFADLDAGRILPHGASAALSAGRDFPDLADANGHPVEGFGFRVFDEASKGFLHASLHLFELELVDHKTHLRAENVMIYWRGKNTISVESGAVRLRISQSIVPVAIDFARHITAKPGTALVIQHSEGVTRLAAGAQSPQFVQILLALVCR